MSYTKQWLILGALLLGCYGLVVLTAYNGQRTELYFPTHEASTARLSMWRIGDEIVGCAREIGRPRRVWLMLPGNAGQAAHRDYILRCVDPGDAVFVLDYPGYGLRPGYPTQTSINLAASQAYRELRGRFTGCPIGVIGESLGTGPACTLAKEPSPPDRIVLITPFDTLLSVAGEHRWYLPVRLLLKDRWDNLAALRGFKNPIEIYAAENDGIIPPHHAQALAEATGAHFTLLPGGHNDWMNTGRVKL